MTLLSIHDSAGRVLAVVEHAERALPLSRRTPGAAEVRRVDDGALISTVRRIAGDHVFSGIWRMKREPEWVS